MIIKLLIGLGLYVAIGAVLTVKELVQVILMHKIDVDNPSDEELEAIGTYAFGWLPRLLSRLFGER